MLRTPIRTVVLLGKENVGKTQLAASLAGAPSAASNFRGATVGCDSYRVDDWELIDTPGLLRSSDVQTTRLALERLRGDDTVLLVAQGTELDADLADLLPLAAGRLGALVVTRRDRLARVEMETRLEELSLRTGLPVVAVDARRLDGNDRRRLMQALEAPGAVPAEAGLSFGDLTVRPRRLFPEHSGVRAALGAAAVVDARLAPRCTPPPVSRIESIPGCAPGTGAAGRVADQLAAAVCRDPHRRLRPGNDGAAAAGLGDTGGRAPCAADGCVQGERPA